MANEWTTLMHRFKDRLEAVEKVHEGSRMWRLCCLEQALELLEEDPDAASKHLDDFDRAPSTQEVADVYKKFEKRPRVEDIRTRFDNLGGGIV
jgi:hypothetical protein